MPSMGEPPLWGRPFPDPPLRGQASAGLRTTLDGPGSPYREVSLSEVLDRVLNRGVVLTGEIVISVADVPLLYVGANLLVSSVETLLRGMGSEGGGEVWP